MGAPAIVTIRNGVQFTPDAAAAFRRAEAQVQKEFRRNIDVNSTYRDWDTQLRMHNNWQAYVNGTGPYPGHSKALHPNDPLAFHTKGTALDSDDWTNARIVAILARNGFIRNRLYVPNENHHFEYIRSEDKNYGQPAGGANSAPAQPNEEEEEEMAPKYTIRETKNTEKDAAKYPIRFALCEATSGYWEEMIDSHYGNMNSLAAAYDTPDKIVQSGSAFAVARAAHAAVRTGK